MSRAVGPPGYTEPHVVSVTRPVYLSALRDIAGAVAFLAVFALDVWDWTPWHPVAAVRLFPYGLATLVAAAWAWSHARRDASTLRSPVDGPLAALLLATGLAGIFSPDPPAAVGAMTAAALLTIWLKYAQELPGARLAQLLLICAALVGLQAVLEFLHWYAGLLGAPPSGISWLETGAGLIPPAHPRTGAQQTLSLTPGLASGSNAIGGYLAALAPLALVCVLGGRSRQTRTLGGLCLVLFLFTLVLVSSRAAWLAAGAGILTFVTLCGWHPGLGAYVPHRLRAASRGPLLLLIGLLPLAGVAFASASWRATSSLERLHLWGEAARIWQANPILGAGPGQFVLAQYAGRGEGPIADLVIHAHSVPFHLAAVLGTAGLAAVTFLALTLARAGWSAIHSPGRQESLVRAGCLSGLASLAVYCLGDLPTHLLTATGAGLAGLLLGSTPYGGRPIAATPPAARQVPHGYRLLLFAVPLTLVVLAFVTDAAVAPWLEARRLGNSGDPGPAAQVLRESGPALGHPALYLQQLGLVETHAGRVQGAYDAFRSVEHAPWSGELLATYSHAAHRLGRGEEAEVLAQRSTHVVPRDPRTHLALGLLHEERGREQAALAAYAGAVILEPGWIQSRFWDGGGPRERRAVLRAALGRLESPASGPESWRHARRAELLRLDGRLSEALQAAESGLNALQEPPARAMFEEMGHLLTGRVENVIERERQLFDPHTRVQNPLYQAGVTRLEAGNVDGARQAFEELRQVIPGGALPYLGRGAVAFARGDWQQATREARVSVVLGGGREAAALLGRSLLASGRPEQAILWLQRGTMVDPMPRDSIARTLYLRPEIAPPVPEAQPELAPDASLAAARRDLEQAYSATGRPR